MENTITLRPFTDQDMDRFKEWLNQPYVAAWYHHPENWIYELENRHTKFNWIHHFIVWHNSIPIGFCQYYEYSKSEETWHGTIPLSGTYSIDYLIGSPSHLKKGLASQIVRSLIAKITLHPDAARIIVQPEPKNIPSCKTLLSSGFTFDASNQLYLLSHSKAPLEHIGYILILKKNIPQTGCKNSPFSSWPIFFYSLLSKRTIIAKILACDKQIKYTVSIPIVSSPYRKEKRERGRRKTGRRHRERYFFGMSGS